MGFGSVHKSVGELTFLARAKVLSDIANYFECVYSEASKVTSKSDFQVILESQQRR